MEWWIWIGLGLALLAVELLADGQFYVLFFGVGAVITGIVVAAGVTGDIVLQAAIFLVASVGALLFFRDRMWEKFRHVDDRAVDAIENEIATVTADIAVNMVGKAELRGTAWNARNIGPDVLYEGQRCNVVKVDGLTLHIRAESHD